MTYNRKRQTTTLAIDPKIEERIRERAQAEGLSITAYIEHLVHAEDSAEDELEALSLESLTSGSPFETGPGYWEETHRRLDERLKRTGSR